VGALETKQDLARLKKQRARWAKLKQPTAEKCAPKPVLTLPQGLSNMDGTETESSDEEGEGDDNHADDNEQIEYISCYVTQCVSAHAGSL
jgi:hypothetical protein